MTRCLEVEPLKLDVVLLCARCGGDLALLVVLIDDILNNCARLPINYPSASCMIFVDSQDAPDHEVIVSVVYERRNTTIRVVLDQVLGALVRFHV